MLDLWVSNTHYVYINNIFDKTTLRISEDIIKQLKHIAIDENKTLTQVIQEALDEYLQQHKRGGKKM